MTHVNQRIMGIAQGYFDVQNYWSSATDDDTTINTGRTYFFRNDVINADSIAPFVLCKEDEVKEAFDGKKYHYVFAEKRQISSFSPSENGGVRKMLDGGYRSRCAFKPFLYQDEKLPFDLTGFEKSTVDTFFLDNTAYARILLVDSSVNDIKLIDSDPLMVTVRETFEVSLSDYSLRRWVQTAHFWKKPQYKEIRFSNIYALSGNQKFSDLFDIDSLIKTGFKWKEIYRKPNNEVPALKIQVGDTVPTFQLSDLNGNTFNVGSKRKGILLLDFWYRGCGPCIQSMPILENIFKRYKDKGLFVYGINGHDKDAASLQRFLSDRDVTYPTLQDSQQLVAQMLDVSAYPTLLIIDLETTKILGIETGYIPDLEAKIEPILTQSGVK